MVVTEVLSTIGASLAAGDMVVVIAVVVTGLMVSIIGTCLVAGNMVVVVVAVTIMVMMTEMVGTIGTCLVAGNMMIAVAVVAVVTIMVGTIGRWWWSQTRSDDRGHDDGHYAAAITSVIRGIGIRGLEVDVENRTHFFGLDAHLSHLKS
ncbi:hypothetical protein F5887DRAFT_923011 [Amanita rubescens]|nr:hypothetical protein F5887DRAFT_923345 [Amanita rubescens]KAF8330603.1 hypothetical protein F5887DRAFT_923011 [Amanita rubescens]